MLNVYTGRCKFSLLELVRIIAMVIRIITIKLNICNSPFDNIIMKIYCTNI